MSDFLERISIMMFKCFAFGGDACYSLPFAENLFFLLGEKFELYTLLLKFP